MDISFVNIIREPKTKTEHPALLLMLHGYGSNEEDLFSFASELPEELLIISVRAPLSLSFGGYAWYSIHFESDTDKFSDIPEAIKARDLIKEYIEKLQNTYNFDPKRSFLMGFSQGTILSYSIALNYPNLVQNYIALSGYMNEELLITSMEQPDYSQLSFFCSHGTEDPVIPVDWARKSQEFLDEKKIDNTYKEYFAGHGVTPQNFADMKQWIQLKLNR